MSLPYVSSEAHGALRQGEIVTDLAVSKLVPETIDTDQPKIEVEVYPFAVTLSQDCDLEQDWKVRSSGGDPSAVSRLLPGVLFTPLYEAVRLKSRGDLNSSLWGRVKLNKDERYHFLEAVPAQNDRLGIGLDELAIDFKRYFTIPTAEVYKRLTGAAQRRCRLASPYLEHLSTRFCYYQFRVALPLNHQSV